VYDTCDTLTKKLPTFYLINCILRCVAKKRDASKFSMVRANLEA
jgi:hypothetical protein